MTLTRLWDANALRELQGVLSKKDVPFKEDWPLARNAYFRMGRLVRIMIIPETSEQLTDAVQIMQSFGMPWKVIGATSNLLFRDDVDYGVLLTTTAMNDLHYDEEASELHAEAGVMLEELARFALRRSWTGYEGLEGIPGTVGGAVVMNAGAYGAEIKDVLIRAEYLDWEGRRHVVALSEMDMQHRNSIFRKGAPGVISQVTFRAKQGERAQILDRMMLYHAKRHKYQDYQYPSLGSLFSGHTKDLYQHMASRDALYRWKLRIMRKLFYSLWFRRERPMHKRLLNAMTCRHFGLTFERKPFSDKNMNCIVNAGASFAELVDYIEQLRKLIGDDVSLENEILDTCFYDGEG